MSEPIQAGSYRRVAVTELRKAVDILEVPDLYGVLDENMPSLLTDASLAIKKALQQVESALDAWKEKANA